MALALLYPCVAYCRQVARDRNSALESHQPPSAMLNFKHSIADKLVLSKIRAKFGGNLRQLGNDHDDV